MSKARKLDNREKVFVQEYLKHLDAKRAAKSAGYADTTADSKAYAWVGQSKLKPHVYQAIQKGMKKREERTQITVDEIVKKLAAIADGEIRTEVSTRSGIAKLPPNFSERTRALELLGRHLSMFTDKTEVTVKGFELDRLSDNELAKLAAGEELDTA